MNLLAVATDLTMNLGAWLMLAFAVSVLGGGLFFCIRRALEVGRKKREEDRAFE